MLAKTPFDEAWTILDIAKAAEFVISEIDASRSPMDCEVVEGAEAEWYLVRAFPGDDAKALRWLARRRFGVFRPMQQRRLKKAGEKLVQGLEPVFPGWLFVFCWDGRKMRPRIEAAPGVMKMLCYPDSGRPVPIGQGFIDRLRALSWIYDERAPQAGHAAVMAGRHVRRRMPRIGKTARKLMRKAQDLKKELKRHGKFDQSTWDQASALAPAERIRLLQRALQGPAVEGLTSSG